MKRILAIVLALAVIAGAVMLLASCGSDEEEITTAATTEALVEDTTAAIDTTAAAVDPSEASTEAPSSAEESSVDASETTTAAPVAAPVNGTVAEIVDYYNNAVNGVCDKTVTVKRVQGTNCKITECSIDTQWILDKANEMLPNDYPDTKTVSFKNGKSDGESLEKFMPRSDGNPGGLTTAAVSKATCTASGSDYKVVINVKDETGNDLNWLPPYHASCMDTLSIKAEDLEPFTLAGATIKYYNSTITAVIGADGNIKSLDIQEPVKVEGDLKITVISLHAVVDAKWQQQYTFTY